MRTSKRITPHFCSFLILAAGLSSCGDSSDEGLPEPGLLPSLSPEAKSPQGPPQIVVDHKGRRWRRGPAAVFAPDERIPDKFPPQPADAREKEERALAAMSDLALAEKLRPTSMHGGYEYSLETPSIEFARQFREYLAKKAKGESPGDERKHQPSRGSAGGEDVDEVEGVPQQIVIGNDDRAQRRTNTSYPYRTMIFITDAATGTAACSAQLVGPSTATSVAHCFKPNASTWYSTRAWAPGVDSQDASPFPFGSWSGCYWVILPAGYSSPMGYYDFAVIEFSNMYPTCNLYPGNTVGWLGWWANANPINLDSLIGYVYGYPGVGCPGGSCNMPQIWGIGSSGLDNDGDNWDHYADTTAGQSGAGLYVKDGTTRYVIGSHQGGYTFIDDWNEARRLEGLFFQYLIDYTAL